MLLIIDNGGEKKRTRSNPPVPRRLSGQDICRNGSLAGPPAVADREQDGPRGPHVRLRQRREDLHHRQRCQDVPIVRSPSVHIGLAAWGHGQMIYAGDFSCALPRLCSLMQRRYSEPNTYIDTPPSNPHNSDELYDDVAFTADPEVCYQRHALCASPEFHLADLQVAVQQSYSATLCVLGAP